MSRTLPLHKYPYLGMLSPLPACDSTGDVGFILSTKEQGVVLRFRVGRDEAAALLESLLDDQPRWAKSGSQSPRSSDSPTVDVSTVPTHSP